ALLSPVFLPLPIPLQNGERVGVRGGCKLQRRRRGPPLTLTLSPRSAGRGNLSRHLLLHPPLQLAQLPAALRQLAQQLGGTPAGAVALVPGGDLVVDLARPDAVGPEHQAAAVAREAE